MGPTGARRDPEQQREREDVGATLEEADAEKDGKGNLEGHAEEQDRIRDECADHQRTATADAICESTGQRRRDRGADHVHGHEQ